MAKVNGGRTQTPPQTHQKHDNYGPNGQRPDVHGNKPGGPDKPGGGNFKQISKHLDMASNIMGCVASAAEMLGALRNLGGGGGMPGMGMPGMMPGMGMPGMGMPGMGMPGMGMPGMNCGGTQGLLKMLGSLLQMMGPLLMMLMASKSNNMPGMGMPGMGGCGGCNQMGMNMMQQLMQMMQKMQGLQMAQQGLQMMQMGLHQMQSPMMMQRAMPMAMPMAAGF
jgi:hypothetical protein